MYLTKSLLMMAVVIMVGPVVADQQQQSGPGKEINDSNSNNASSSFEQEHAPSSLRGTRDAAGDHYHHPLLASLDVRAMLALDAMADWAQTEFDGDFSLAFAAVDTDGDGIINAAEYVSHLQDNLAISTEFVNTADPKMPMETDGNAVDVDAYHRILKEKLGFCYTERDCNGSYIGPMSKKECCKNGDTAKSWKEGKLDSSKKKFCQNLNEGLVCGDPHFTTWSGEKYDFHGQCDLVLVRNHGFADGLGMDIHIRTKIHNDWSAVESAAIKIGDEVFEISGRAGHWLNGVADPELPAFLGRFEVSVGQPGPNTRRFVVHLGNGQKVRITTFKEFVSVAFDDLKDFEGSDGLLGAYETGYKVGRDGNTIINDWNTFGQEWQVLATDPKLFHVDESPQYPEKCLLPSKVKDVSRRRLNGLVYTEAEEACSHVNGAERDDCIFDVLATADVDMAGAY
jgi:hypothetical protein